MIRYVYLALGLLMVALGIIGAFLPVMPTTTFLIIAVFFFARSSPRLEAWVLNHKQFGPPVRNWQENRAISRKGKIASALGMTVGFTMFWFFAKPNLWLWLGVLAFFIACAIFVWTRPTGAPVAVGDQRRDSRV